MASFRFAADCPQGQENAPPPEPFFRGGAEWARPGGFGPRGYRDALSPATAAQLAAAAESGAVFDSLEEIPRVAPDSALTPGQVSPLAALGLLAFAAWAIAR